jgi:oxygen-dependent protoporphyrinogen oxidase
MDLTMHVIIVGGGIAGLSAAFTLVSAGEQVTLIEASRRLGGQIRTRLQDGFLIEDGAEGFPIRRESVRALCRGLALEHRLIDQQVRRTLSLNGGRLSELNSGEAATLLGIATEPGDNGAGLSTFRNGMGELIDALGEYVRTYGRVLIRWRATRLSRHQSGWQVSRGGAPPVTGDAVILALPGWETEALLEPVIGGVTDLRMLSYTTSLTVSLAFPRDQVDHPLDATGFVAGDPIFRACSFSSSKFAHRAPPGWSLIRLFMRPDLGGLHAPDEVWIGYARQQVAGILGLRPGSWPAWVSRWPRVFPQFPADQQTRFSRMLQRIEGAGVRLDVAGAATGAVGVDGAIRSGQNAAARILGGVTV